MLKYEKPYVEIIDLFPKEAIMEDFSDEWVEGEEGEEDW